MPGLTTRPLVLLLAGVLVAGCGTRASGGTEGDGRLTGTVTVLAGSSLTEALTAVGAAFEADHPAVDVDLSFGGSSRLAAQILEGAPGDVFAAADETTMAQVVTADRTAGTPMVVATNRLVIVVPAGNPLSVGGLADLATVPRVALCQRAVPCGTYARDAFAAAGLGVPAASEEESVRGVLTKVLLGEADAGVVYATDVRGRPEVEAVPLPVTRETTARYPVAVLADAPNPSAAQAFVTFLAGPAGQSILRDAGFGGP